MDAQGHLGPEYEHYRTSPVHHGTMFMNCPQSDVRYIDQDYMQSSPAESLSSSPRSAYSPMSCGSSGVPSPIRGNTPSPTTASYPSNNSKLYNILTNSTSSVYQCHDAWREEPLNLKRKSSPEVHDQPMDLSCKKARSQSDYSFSASPQSDNFHSTFNNNNIVNNNNNKSMFEAILSGEMNHADFQREQAKSWGTFMQQQVRSAQTSTEMYSSSAQSSCFSSSSSSSSSSNLHSGCCSPRNPHRVCLAKKNLLPVTARVSDWIVKIIQFGHTLPDFASLPHNDKMTLVLNSWTRLLLLYMAETNFQFVVAEQCYDKDMAATEIHNLEVPTMKGVEVIQRFITKCQALNLDASDYYYLKLVTLFNPCYVGVDNGQYIENVSTCARQALRDHIRQARPDENLRYSRVLMCLPRLFGVDCKMVENLFCKHITDNTDMEVLLKEMIQKPVIA